MLHRVLFVLAFTTLLAGCQNQQYKILCEPSYGAAKCDTSNLDSLSCGATRGTIRTCAAFVVNEVNALAAKKGQQLTTTQPYYSRPGTEVLSLGSYGSGPQVYAYVDARTPGAYVQSVHGAQNVMSERVSHYKMAADRYVNDVVSGTIVASDSDVLKAIAAIDAMRGPMAKAVEMSKPILDYYAAFPTTDFASLANQVVLKTNARDPYLRAAADLAIQRESEYNANRPFTQVQAAAAQFEALHTVAMVSYADQFAEVKKQAVILAAQAAQVAKKKRAQEQAYEKQYGSSGGYHGGGCSCAGSNACYGPRGGRYCITSGGNKRYF